MISKEQHDEYCRRNVVHANAVGAEYELDKTLERLRKTKGTPKWLLRDLEKARSRAAFLPHHLAAYRDAAVNGT